MSYQLIYSPDARADVSRIPQQMLGGVEEHLLALAERPTLLSRPSHFPYPTACQIYEFDLWDDVGERNHFAVMFRYGRDEVSLQVLRIGHHRLI
jgi:hypothetical protein